MDYAQVSEWLQSLTNPERTGLSKSFGRRMNLDATRRLLSLLGNPHERITAIHIAGTKGKGSVAAMVESICRVADLRTGLFTSPHLVSWRERIRIDGRCVSEERVADLATQVRPAVEEVEREGLRGPSFFEALTAMGMLAFAEEAPDICVLETGLGGRLDATNVVMPTISVITTLGLDHTEILGETLPEIAMQKAGIMKPGVRVIVAPQPESIQRLLRRTAQGVGAPILFADPFSLLDDGLLSPAETSPDEPPVLGETMWGSFWHQPFAVKLPLVGRHQAINAGVATKVAEELKRQKYPVELTEVKKGLAGVRWPGRVELVETHPWLVIDCAHNQPSARALMTAIRRHLRFDRMILVLGASRDKPVEAMVREMQGAHHAILTEAALPRAMRAATLEERTRRYWRSHEIIPAATDALDRARELAGPHDLICVTGSVFLIGDLIEAGAVTSSLCDL